jgi:hypothetical protein
LKSDHGIDRNYLRGETGDKINALLAGCGFNMKKLLRAFLCPLLRSLCILQNRFSVLGVRKMFTVPA